MIDPAGRSSKCSDGPWRLLHVTSVFSGRGGAERYLQGLCEELALRGHQVEVWVAGSDRSVTPAAGSFDVHHFPNDRRLLGRYPWSSGLWRELRRAPGRFDLVHVHQPFAPSTWMTLGRRVAAVATLYSHPLTAKRWGAKARQRLQLRLLLGRLRGLVLVSEGERKQLESEVGKLRVFACVARPGVGPKVREAVPWPRSRPLVLGLGRLAELKRHDLLIAAMSSLAGDADLRIVGGGPDRHRLAQLCQAAGFDPEEVLLGELPDDHLYRWLRSADVFATFSREESFGIALLEAAAAGARLVCSDLPSHREILDLAGGGEGNLWREATGAEGASARLRWALAAGRPGEAQAARLPRWSDSARAAESLYAQALGRPPR